MTTAINIPFALVPTVNLSAYGPKRTFVFIAASGAVQIKIWGAADGVNFPPTTATPLLTLGGEAPPKTIDDLSLAYRALVSGGVGTLCTVDVQLDCCEDGGGSFLQTTTILDRPAGGPIGLATATVDIYQAFLVNQTTAGQALTLPAPTDPTATRRAYVENIGTVGFDLYGQFLLVGAWLELLWNGTTWTPSVGNSDGTNSSIGTTGGANGVTISAGSGDLVGNVTNGGAIQMFTDSGAIQIDSSAGGAIQIGSVVASVKAITIGNLVGATATTIRSGTGPLAIESTATINIGVNGVAQTINIGNLIGATGVGVQTGTAGFAVQTTGVGPIAMSTGTTGTVTIDSGTTGAINIGTNANPKTITVGNLAGADNVILRSSINMDLEVAAGGVMDIGTNATDHAVNIGSATLASSVTISSGTGGVLVGTNATDHAVTVGSLTGASLTTIQGGTSGVTVQPAATGPVSITTGTTGALTLDSGSTGAINVGTNANAKTITIGNATGATSVVINVGTGAAQFGANATVHTTTIGSITGASATALRAGTGGLTLVNNGVTWTWPTAVGAAGSQLTDAAGNGILSWV